MSRVRRFRYIDGKVQEVTETPAAATVGPMVGCGYSESTPGYSESISCMPEEVPFVREKMRERGVVGVEWDNTGKAVITSRKGRATALKEYGQLVGLGPLHDRDGGFSDG